MNISHIPIDLSKTGNIHPEIPLEIIETLRITELSSSFWYWLGKSKDAYYKLARRGTSGLSLVRSEAAILGRLNHPNLAVGRLIQIQDWEILEVDAICGQPVAKLRDQLNTDEKLKVLDDLTETITYINREGILHTDVKLDNVIWDGTRAHLIDFEHAKPIKPPISIEDSPDFIGGPPCCWGDFGYGYKTYACLDSFRTCLFKPEFIAVERELSRVGVRDPISRGNTCEPWSTPDDGSSYQSIRFGDEVVSGQGDPEVRFRYLSTIKKMSFDNKRILEIGCNLGRVGAFLEKLGIAQYVGLDVNPSYIDVAARLSKLEGRTKSTFVWGDICSGAAFETLSALSPVGYDVVICHEIKDREVFWSRISNLGCKWFILEGPVGHSRYALNESLVEQREFLCSKGYEIVHESLDHDYPSGGVVALLEKSRTQSGSGCARHAI